MNYKITCQQNQQLGWDSPSLLTPPRGQLLLGKAKQGKAKSGTALGRARMQCDVMQCDGTAWQEGVAQGGRGCPGLGYMKFLFYLNVIICLNKKMLIMMSSGGDVSEQKRKHTKTKTKNEKRKKVKNASSCA